MLAIFLYKMSKKLQAHKLWLNFVKIQITRKYIIVSNF